MEGVIVKFSLFSLFFLDIAASGTMLCFHKNVSESTFYQSHEHSALHNGNVFCRSTYHVSIFFCKKSRDPGRRNAK